MAHLYTATARGLTAGITIPTGGLLLGEAGRSRVATTVAVAPGLLGTRPEAATVVVAGKGRAAIEAGPGGDSVVVRAQTSGVYTRGCPGKIDAGGWTTLTSGAHAWGAAGNLGVMPDVLLGAKGPAVACLTFSGGRSKRQGLRLLLALDRGGNAPSVWLLDLGEGADPSMTLGASTLTPAEIETAAALCDAAGFEKSAATLRESLSVGAVY